MVINTKELNIAITLGYIKEAEKFYYILLHIYIASFRIMERADVENFEIIIVKICVVVSAATTS